VVGVEKATDVVGAGIENRLLSTGLDSDFEASEGLTLVGQASLLLQRYLYENQFPREALGQFPIIAHNNAVNNPYAMYRRAINLETYRNAREDTGAFNQFDIAPNADGAAALILTRQEFLAQNPAHAPVRCSACPPYRRWHCMIDLIVFLRCVSRSNALLKKRISFGIWFL
jgi:acetyl-CoA C-acetyltransferase